MPLQGCTRHGSVFTWPTPSYYGAGWRRVLVCASDRTSPPDHPGPDPQGGPMTATATPPAKQPTDKTEIRPFTVSFSDADLAELRRRVTAARLPERETESGFDQGVPLATVEKLAARWAEYDWRKCEARLNAVPNFITEIDGLDIHFIHVRSKHENALPVIITHGWPGSVVE